QHFGGTPTERSPGNSDMKQHDAIERIAFSATCEGRRSQDRKEADVAPLERFIRRAAAVVVTLSLPTEPAAQLIAAAASPGQATEKPAPTSTAATQPAQTRTPTAAPHPPPVVQRAGRARAP